MIPRDLRQRQVNVILAVVVGIGAAIFFGLGEAGELSRRTQCTRTARALADGTPVLAERTGAIRAPLTEDEAHQLGSAVRDLSARLRRAQPDFPGQQLATELEELGVDVPMAATQSGSSDGKRARDQVAAHARGARETLARIVARCE
jgi:hypothetical protein